MSTERRKRSLPGDFAPKEQEIITDAERVKELFMKSTYVEWAPFAISIGWNPSASRLKYPVSEWTREKKHNIATVQAETIGDQIFNHRSQWHKQVLETLSTYPKMVDQMTGICMSKMNVLVEQINHDSQNADKISKGKSKRAFTANCKDIVSLAQAIDTLVRAKHRSLLIDSWSFKVAETFSEPQQIQGETKRDTWTVQLVGDSKKIERMNTEDFAKHMKAFYDQPESRDTDPLDMTSGEEEDA